MSVLILDGIPAAGKSIFLANIQKLLLEKRKNFSKLILTEHLTERYFEDKKVSYEMVTDHVTNLLSTIRNLTQLQRNSKFKDKHEVVSIVIERLFLTLMSRTLLKFEFFEENRSWLDELNLHSILLYIPEECLRSRLESTLELRNDNWKNHITSLGGLENAIEHYKYQQDLMKTLSSKLSQYMKVSVIEVYDVHHIPIANILDI